MAGTGRRRRGALGEYELREIARAVADEVCENLDEKYGDRLNDGNRLIDVREVARIIGYSTSWIDEMRAKGRFPKPDIPKDKLGNKNLWWISTIRRWLAQFEDE